MAAPRRLGQAECTLVAPRTDAAGRRHRGRRGDHRRGFRYFVFFRTCGSAGPLLPVFAAVILIAAVGAADDIRSIGVAPRLLLQALAVAVVIYALPSELRVAPFLPWWIERVLLVLGGLWFVNLVNFMDGLDWMTVAEVVPITAALAMIGAFGLLPPAETIISFALCGAMIGFAYFNRPVAKLFLGDVGSLPVGLLLGWLLMQLAGHHGLAAAILLPLYYLADATITLIRRLLNGEPVWQAHRSHFYQRATDRGFTVNQVVAHVFAVNLGLVALACITLAAPGADKRPCRARLRRGFGRLAVVRLCPRTKRDGAPAARVTIAAKTYRLNYPATPRFSASASRRNRGRWFRSKTTRRSATTDREFVASRYKKRSQRLR